MVGSHFVQSFADRYEISALGRTNIFSAKKGVLADFARVDLTDHALLEDTVGSSSAEYVVNFAAQTGVDACESEKDDLRGPVYLTNTSAVASLASVCGAHGKLLFQISTDAIFDGALGPYSEDVTPGPIHSPLSWYGHTKYLAEQEVIKKMSDYCIVRISNPYRSRFERKTDFARHMIELYEKHKLHPLFDDQMITPSFVDDISTALAFLIDIKARGVFNVASRNSTTPLEFGRLLISTFFPNSDPSAVLASSARDAEARGRAPRPIRGGLKTDKIVRLGFKPRTFQEGIREMFRQIQQADR